MTEKSTGNAASGGRMTQAERSALSDQRMFEAAIKLINERGTQNTTLKEVGELAGYSRGLANYRFGSKAGLMQELFARFEKRWKKHLRSYVGDRTGIDAVLAAAEALRKFLKLEPSYMRAMYILWYESVGHESEIRNKLVGHHSLYRKDATGWIKQGIADGQIDPSVNAEQFAIQYCAFVFGIVYQWLVNPEALDLDAIFDHYEVTTKKLLSKKE